MREPPTYNNTINLHLTCHTKGNFQQFLGFRIKILSGRHSKKKKLKQHIIKKDTRKQATFRLVQFKLRLKHNRN